jgi:AcrR family transcriptional regulator
MPKSTFFHLPEEKQKRLLEAARIEFSRTSLQDASIANIVKIAEIPRGSFYQYFKDKEDLYFYYFSSLRKDKERDIEKHIALSDGDFIKGIDDYFSKLITEILIGENASFYRNLFMNMDYRSSNRVTNDLAAADKKEDHRKHKTHQEHREYTERLYNMIDLSKVNISNQTEFKWLAQLAMHAVFSSIADGYRQLKADPDYDIQQTVQQFKKKLSWLRHGAYK